VTFLFFISLIIVAYTYIGYPLILALASLVAARPVKREDIFPVVSVIISAYNEEKNIESKINNLLALDYPRDKMEVIIGSDGSTDDTYRLIKKYAEENKIRYTVSFQRIGKPAMINKMAKDAQGDIFIFADARQRFERDSIKQLVRCFADEEVGAASGELIIEDKETGTGRGMGLYWQYELALRKMESDIGSITGATGAIYAVRKSLFRYLPEDILLDDVYTPMNVFMQGKRVIFEPAARAYDTVSETTQKEFVRKVRTLAGNFQIFAQFPEALNLFKKGWAAFQLISHKLMRLFVPYFLILALFSNFFILKNGSFYVLALFLQIIFYGTAFMCYALEQMGAKIQGALRLAYVPYEFCVLNYAAIVALYAYRSGRAGVQWEK
jgi:cellulose synthase/poly-beta-1,6-N-acetylglucosamine synthase-like glycosyltransferase